MSLKANKMSSVIDGKIKVRFDDLATLDFWSFDMVGSCPDCDAVWTTVKEGLLMEHDEYCAVPVVQHFLRPRLWLMVGDMPTPVTDDDGTVHLLFSPLVWWSDRPTD